MQDGRSSRRAVLEAGQAGYNERFPYLEILP